MWGQSGRFVKPNVHLRLVQQLELRTSTPPPAFMVCSEQMLYTHFTLAEKLYIPLQYATSQSITIFSIPDSLTIRWCVAEPHFGKLTSFRSIHLFNSNERQQHYSLYLKNKNSLSALCQRHKKIMLVGESMRCASGLSYGVLYKKFLFSSFNRQRL